MTVTGNKVNELAIMLKHQFSKITTKLDARQVGNISAVTNAAFTPAFASADISFATDALSITILSLEGKLLVFNLS